MPPTIKECKFQISVDLTTVPLPPGSLLVSGVYHIETVPFIDQFNQPVEISMEHCANDIDNLRFVVAKDNSRRKFEYMEGGRFEIDSKTGRKIGRICVSSFSTLDIVWEWITWFAGCIAYCGRVYYDDSQSKRTVHFVITKNLQLAKHVRDHIHCAHFKTPAHESFLPHLFKALIIGQ